MLSSLPTSKWRSAGARIAILSSSGASCPNAQFSTTVFCSIDSERPRRTHIRLCNRPAMLVFRDHSVRNRPRARPAKGLDRHPAIFVTSSIVRSGPGVHGPDSSFQATRSAPTTMSTALCRSLYPICVLTGPRSRHRSHDAGILTMSLDRQRCFARLGWGVGGAARGVVTGVPAYWPFQPVQTIVSLPALVLSARWLHSTQED